MPMYDLIEHNYFKPSGSLWQYCKDIPAANNSVDIVGFNGTNATASFNFKAKTTHQTRNNWTKETGIMVPLKYLNNLLRSLEMPLNNCEVNIIPMWSTGCYYLY